MRQLVVLYVILFFTLSIYSQNSIKDELHKLSDSRKGTSHKLIPLKVMLPCDFSTYLSGGYIGISDPKVDSATAYNQAFMRALSVYGLHNAKARGMSDYFNDATMGSVASNYEEFCELKSECNLPVSSFKVATMIRLKSGEMLLKLEIDSTAKKSAEQIHFKSSVEIYNKETDVDGVSKTTAKIAIKNTGNTLGNSQIHTEVLTYFLSNNRWFSQESVLDSMKIDNRQYKLFYVTDTDCKNDTTGFEDKAFGTTDGLWFAFANSIYTELSSQLKPQLLNVKQVGDRYENKLTSLNRESGFFRFSTTLKGGVYFENKIYTKIKTEFYGN